MNKNIPALRFREFNGDWEKKKLGDIGLFIGGGTPSTQNSELWNGNVPWISSSDLTEDNIYQINLTRFITKEAITNSATKIVPPNSIIIVSRVGVGKVAINKEELCTSQDFTSLVLNTGNYVFIAYLVKIKTIYLLGFNQGTSIKGFVKSDLETLDISFPTLAEQNKIASFFTVIDKKIALLKQKKSLLEQYKKGVMQQLFSQQLRFKDANGNAFPDWEEKKLGEITKITTGSSNREDSNLDGEYTFFDRSIDIRYSNRFLFDAEAIIVPGEGQEFIPKYFIGKFDLHQRTYAIMNFDNQNGKFLFYSISYNSNHLNSHAVGSTVKSLRLPMFETMPINFPCLAEQIKIANFLSVIDKGINLNQTLIDKTELWKKGMLQKMFC